LVQVERVLLVVVIMEVRAVLHLLVQVRQYTQLLTVVEEVDWAVLQLTDPAEVEVEQAVLVVLLVRLQQ
jgi:hypothetical protein